MGKISEGGVFKLSLAFPTEKGKKRQPHHPTRHAKDKTVSSHPRSGLVSAARKQRGCRMGRTLSRGGFRLSRFRRFLSLARAGGVSVLALGWPGGRPTGFARS